MRAFLAVGLVTIGLCALSWIVTCGLVWVVCACFDLAFKWSVATGVWVLMCLARTIFSHNVTVKR